MLLLGTSLVKLRMNTLQVSLCQPESERVGSFHPVGPLLHSQVAPSALLRFMLSNENNQQLLSTYKA